MPLYNIPSSPRQTHDASTGNWPENSRATEAERVLDEFLRFFSFSSDTSESDQRSVGSVESDMSNGSEPPPPYFEQKIYPGG
jgi:hypothetical protein